MIDNFNVAEKGRRLDFVISLGCATQNDEDSSREGNSTTILYDYQGRFDRVEVIFTY